MTNNDSDLPEGLAAPARRALAQAGFIRIQQFTDLTEAEVSQLHGIGRKAVDLIRLALAAKGLTFARSPATRRSHAPGSR
jgi:DNA-directed RNA polymerase alpha subunit